MYGFVFIEPKSVKTARGGLQYRRYEKVDGDHCLIMEFSKSKEARFWVSKEVDVVKEVLHITPKFGVLPSDYTWQKKLIYIKKFYDVPDDYSKYFHYDPRILKYFDKYE
jgi:hypothetical protein